MAFSVFFSLTLILFISFCATKRRSLNLLEILFLWMIFVFIHHPLLTIIALNLKLITFPHEMQHYWTLVMIRITLYPLLMIWFLDYWIAMSLIYKVFWFPLGVVLVACLEYLGDVFGIYKHTHWKIGWSFLEWAVLFFVLFLNLIWFRKILYKELGDTDARTP